MTNQPNKAGKSTRDMAKRRRKAYFQIGLIAIGVLTVFWLISANQKALGIGGGAMLVLLVIALVFKAYAERMIDKGSKGELRAIRGAKAEEKVGDILAQLSPDYLVIHDVISANGNIDHIVISRMNGIFLIETKAHGGTVTVKDGTLLVNNHLPEKDFIKQTIGNAYWLRDVVTKVIGEAPWITPVIVFTNAFVKSNASVKGVTVVNKKYLLPNPVNAKVWAAREEVRRKLVAY
jgi:LmbE family N-acetylglucosaminyl deacetylase